MSAWTVPALLLGIVCLVAGAEFLVKGAASVAERLGIQPVVIGLTVVAFGTSAPELAVSASAALSGETDVALGNVVGSNIGNILLILGASAVVGGLAVSQRIVRIDLPLVIAVSIVVLLMSLDNAIGRFDGALLAIGIITYTTWLVRAARREKPSTVAQFETSNEAVEGKVAERPLPFQLMLVLVGLTVLVVGSQLLVGAATDIATEFGVSELVIGLTVVAIGTSLPELATSMLAAFRGQREIAVGNVVGSNLFNLMSVLGITGVVASDGIPVSDAALRLDFPVMLAATIVLLPIFWNGFEIKRWEGALLITFYAGYVAYLVLDSSDHDAQQVVGPAVLIAGGLALLAFSVTGFQGWQRHRRERPLRV
ncbi:MAG: calcium/sodium antiporter [Acidimicrobiales bacterium]|nr:calcium/sodium antiporter [Acidimicrobiales bacterium]